MIIIRVDPEEYASCCSCSASRQARRGTPVVNEIYELKVQPDSGSHSICLDFCAKCLDKVCVAHLSTAKRWPN
jgi:hypothetical protein